MASEFFKSLEEYVAFVGGDHVIHKVLIANNGIGAVKAIRSIRRWSYETFGNERTVQFVVMATPEDVRANAEYIRLADEVVDVPGGSNNNNYANVNLICEIADRLLVDAVLPLWGHASENPSLPSSLLKCHRRISFVGPAAEPMQALGDKIGSTIIAQSAGVPTIAWNADSLKVDYKNTGIPAEVYEQADVKTVEEAIECCHRIGLPVMIKASEGGGGKGIRKVNHEAEIASMYRQVHGEIPGSPIFVMKLASGCRHIEVQLIADRYGEAIALSGRDCSVQRRHQKIIEEGPPVATSQKVFREMEKAAVALAKTVDYCSAGTVEYLYVEEDQSFAFLELNPRLQVEHPVTENILGINLPACQLQVAMGAPLHRIADIRKLYGRNPRGRDTIDFEYSERLPTTRHCIAVRITAENPEAGFQPTSGKLEELHFRSSPDVWGYFSVDSSGLVHEFADSQFGHVFAHGSDRESARRAMVVALKELEIRGEIRTTMEYIVRLLQSEDFIDNRIDTSWLDNLISGKFQLVTKALDLLPATLVATCGAALLGYQQLQRRGEAFVELLRLGQVPNEKSLSVDVNLDLIYCGTKYCIRCQQRGPNSLDLMCNNSSQMVYIRVLSDGGFLINVQGKSHVAYCKEEGDGCSRVILDGQTCVFTPEKDPTRLTSSVAGKITKLLVVDGAHLRKGEPYVEIEVMKMYMSLKTEEDGIVSFQKSEGATLKPGDLIATLTLDRPDLVLKAKTFSGPLVEPPPQAPGHALIRPQLAVREASSKLNIVLNGFACADGDISAALDQLKTHMMDPMLPLLEVEESLAVLRGRLDSKVFADIQALLASYEKVASKGEGSSFIFPAGAILTLIHQHIQALSQEKRGSVLTLTMDLWTLVEKYLYQPNVRILMILLGYTQKYLSVEKLFDSMSFTDVVNGLRKDNSDDLNKVLDLCRSHVNLTAKNTLLLQVIDLMKEIHVPADSQSPKLPPGVPLRSEVSVRTLKRRLVELSLLRQACYARVSLAASLVLMEQSSLAPEQRRLRLHDALVAALSTGEPIGGVERTHHLVKFNETNIAIKDIFLETLLQDRDYQIAALELYVRKVYDRTHELGNLQSGLFLHTEHANEAYSCPWLTFSYKSRIFFQAPVKSSNDLSDRASCWTSSASQTGMFAVTDSVEDMKFLLPLMLSSIGTKSRSSGTIASPEPRKQRKVNALHVIIMRSPGETHDPNGFSKSMQSYLQSQQEMLLQSSVNRISFFVGNAKWKTAQNFGDIFTFRSSDGYCEDDLFRNIEAPHAFHLDLPRLANFDILHSDGYHSLSGNVHVYKAIPKGSSKKNPRFFARLVSFSSDSTPAAAAEAETVVVEALDTMSLVVQQGTARTNHIFLNIVAPDTVIQPSFYEAALRRICTKYASKLVRLSVAMVELKLTCLLNPNDPEPTSMRFVASDPTGFALRLDKYVEEVGRDRSVSYSDSEYTETSGSGFRVFRSVNPGPPGVWDGQLVSTPYDVSERFEKERADAQMASDTLYVYDWPILFQRAAEIQWEEYLKLKMDMKPSSKSAVLTEIELPEDIFDCQELVLCRPGSDDATHVQLPTAWTAEDALTAQIVPMRRDAGENECGMVCFEMTIRTPEYPKAGRRIVVISNDISKEAGSFGTREDAMFFKASEYARHHGLPRLFLAANSGARIGMAQSLKALFNVCWTDPDDPGKGFKYIYLKESDYQAQLAKVQGDVSKMPVICSTTKGPEGDTRYVITDIIGEEPDLGVENLSGSGLIAGETSRAYDDIFTLTLVVGRTVGIGAYLVRLGQRTIQKMHSSPIILTGYQALNKLMGRDIYSTNDQLGGPSIMFHNGVSHLLADSHLNAVTQALNWLSFIPCRRGAPIPIRNISGIDSVERPVSFVPTKGQTYDPRLLLRGLPSSATELEAPLLGFFDRDSFVEMLAGWAKTVVVGRARLGGIPMGVIVTENRTAEATKPADPADVTSREKMVQQAGGVWFPDSAYKTAQALRDFSREDIPCIIFANWRGFSGGQRDMFDEVLKFGSMIVDALVAYRQPLFAYIPPHAELRGGAWVVVDSTINEDVMEFYAAEDSRGGVLEAAGAATIKFREKDVLAAARRLDPALVSMQAQLADKTLPESGRQALAKDMALRESRLMGVYSQLAVHFADLHDTPGRMVRTGVVRRQVDWAESRTFFYWRLRRRLADFDLARQMLQADDTFTSRKEAVAQVKVWYQESGGAEVGWDDDKAMMQWYDDNQVLLQRKIGEVRSSGLARQLRLVLNKVSSSSDLSGVIRKALEGTSSDDRKSLLDSFSKVILDMGN